MEKNYWLVNPKWEGTKTDLAEESLDRVYMGWNETDCPKFYKEVKHGDVIIITEGAHNNTRLHFIGLADRLNKREQSWVLAYSTQDKNDEVAGIIKSKPSDFSGGESSNPWGPTKSIIKLNDNPTEVRLKNILDDYFQKIIKEEEMNALKTLLINNFNLILTGAPGTGKTYLAKLISEKIALQEVRDSPIKVLESAIDCFTINEHIEQGYENLLNKFYELFPIENLQKMALKDYCIGNSYVNNNNFCYWIERRLKPLGYYFPGSSRSYLLYWNKSDNEYKVHGYLKQESGKSNEELMTILASDIYNMVKNNDSSYMENKYGDSLILKILSTYYPNQYAPINSGSHIDNILALLDIKCESDSIFEKNKAIYRFYREITKNKNISVWSFMHILYSNFNIKEGEILREGKINNNGEYCLVQFHPSYDYTDFVEGLRPRQDDNGSIVFERRNGVFKELCEKAVRNPQKNYVIIIDEINRGEISKIFGELFFSIDPGYRGEKGKVKTQYQNLVEEDDEFYDGFYVPKNVYIIGTMNDIDRSVESMDFAFRRRFAFKEIKAKDTQNMLEDFTWKDEAIKRMDRLNDEISKVEGLSSAYHIGASYFLKLKNYEGDFDKLWDYHIEGLLREYLRGIQDVEGKILKLKEAYDNESDSSNGQQQ